MNRLIIYSAYFLKTCARYQQCKTFFRDLLENSHSKMKSYFDMMMICLVMSSVFLLIYEIEAEIGTAGEIFEQCIVTLFISEYLLRFWIYSDIHKVIISHHEKTEYLNIKFRLFHVFKKIVGTKLKYVVSVVSIIDLLAILPSYRPLRFLRIFLIFRLFKIFRYSNSVKLFSDVLLSKRFEILTLGIFMGLLVFIASIAIYLFENPKNGGQVRDLYDGLYWAMVTMSTVGYGDITPQTSGGRIITVALILIGLVVLSFFTSIIVSAFNDKILSLRENRTYVELGQYDEFIIICGYGRVGQEIADKFQKDQQQVVIIDKENEHVLLAKSRGFLAIHDDASRNQVLLNAGINSGAIAVLCTTDNDITNVYITLSSRYLNPSIKIISRANREDNIKKLKQAGADHVIQPFKFAGLLAAEYIGQPVAFEAVIGILQEKKTISMDTLIVYEGCLLENKSLLEIAFEKRKLSLMGVISSKTQHRKHRNRYVVKDQHFFFNPEKHFICQKNDILVVLGRDVSIEHFRDQVEKSRF